MDLEMDTSALEDELYPEQTTPPIRIEVGAASNEITEALVASMNSLADRIQAQADLAAEQAERQELIAEVLGGLAALVKQDREAFTAALVEMSEAIKQQPEPVVNVTVPETVVNVAAPPAPQVDVHLPASSRTVTVKRDALTGLISSADVVEA